LVNSARPECLIVVTIYAVRKQYSHPLQEGNWSHY
jgi:hypothetical protein